jgi:hypothetical protein
MQMAITFLAALAGLALSLAVALLAEEFIFGRVFRMFFISNPQPVTAPGPTRTEEGQKR